MVGTEELVIVKELRFGFSARCELDRRKRVLKGFLLLLAVGECGISVGRALFAGIGVLRTLEAGGVAGVLIMRG